MMNATQVRAMFPALGGPTVFLDNAGGSQLPRAVIASVAQYLEGSYAQLGGEYPESVRAVETIARARLIVKRFLNAEGVGEVILGPSSTGLCHLIANAYADEMARALSMGDAAGSKRHEIVVAAAGHEANIGPWKRLEARGFKVRLWPTERGADGWKPRIETLKRMVSERTRVVAFPHVSNILGEVWDAKEVCDVARSVGARSMIDGVAYAPHHAPDVQAIGCDWYVYSIYKVYGLHMGAMFGRAEAMAELTGPNHFFIAKEEVPRKFEPGGVSHEGCAGIVGFERFVAELLDGGQARSNPPPSPLPLGGGVRALSHDEYARCFGALVERERAVAAPLVEFLAGHPRARVIGPASMGPDRVATISFVCDGIRCSDLAKRANAEGLAIRWGHFYSKRLVEEMGLNPEDGVARASLLHYNTADEVKRVIVFLNRALG